jgi:cell fate regulator YaaT (PSP1 superfamily)
VHQLVEVRFKGNRKAYFEWHDPEPLRLREPVIVQAERGVDYGLVSALGEVAKTKCERCAACAIGPGVRREDASGREQGERSEDSRGERRTQRRPPEPTRKVVRRAGAGESRTHEELRKAEDDVRRKVREKVAAHGLAMKVSDAEWQWDRNKLTVYFTAEHRVDFRNLVRELASLFRTRIDLRQIGVRDEAARLSGVGRCGREYCSASWLPELRPIGLHIAKDQRLSLNPSQISGPCGRLLCCLRYEHEFYVQSRKRFPKEGKVLQTSKGAEKVVSVDIFRDRVTLRCEDGTVRTVELAELKGETQVGAAVAAAAAATQGLSADGAAASLPRPEGRARPTAGTEGPNAPGPSGPAVAEPGLQTVDPDAGNAEPGPKRRRRRRRRRRGGGGQGGGGESPATS